MFVTAWVFEALHYPTLLNEIKKTKLDNNTEPQAGINILLCLVRVNRYFLKLTCLKFAVIYFDATSPPIQFNPLQYPK